MTLNKKSLDLSYKILANLQVKNYNSHISDIKKILLAAFVDVYTKARHEESQGTEWDIASQMNDVNIDD